MYTYKLCKKILQKHLRTNSVTKTLTPHELEKNGGHLGRHLGFLKTPRVNAKVPGSLINFRLCRTF